jgi:hypothetical protein
MKAWLSIAVLATSVLVAASLTRPATARDHAAAAPARANPTTGTTAIPFPAVGQHVRVTLLNNAVWTGPLTHSSREWLVIKLGDEDPKPMWIARRNIAHLQRVDPDE